VFCGTAPRMAEGISKSPRGVTLGPVAYRCIIPIELQLVWNDASGCHQSLIHWKSNDLLAPMHQRTVVTRCINLVLNDASGRHRTGPSVTPPRIVKLVSFNELK